jgi:hypothetical protein
MTVSNADRTRERPVRRHRRTLLVLTIVAAFGILPTIALAGHTFTDVPDTNVHHANISAIAEVGVTTGCTPTEYCPSDPVRRDAMGSFLARLGGLGDNPPVVNAASAVTATSAASADDATMLAGAPPSAYTTTVFSASLEEAVELSELSTVLSISDLPAGEYVINAQATAHRATDPVITDRSTVRCRIDVVDGEETESVARGEVREVGTEPDGLRRITFPIIAHVSAVPADAELQLVCASFSVSPAGAFPLIVGTDAPVSGDTTLIATRVGD